MMTGLFRSSADLFAELQRMHNLLEQVFPSTLPTGIRARGGGEFPVINVGSTPTSFEVMALAPGLAPDKLEITVDRGLLVIEGERASSLPAEDERTAVYASERFAGRFRRVLSLPEEADPARIDASYRDGVLRITIARRAAAQPRRIEVH